MKKNQDQSSPQHGGKRAGAGRKKGVPNKRTAALRDAVAASGATPLDVMLSTMRWAHSEAETLLQAVYKALDEIDAGDADSLKAKLDNLRAMEMLALDAAARAAPYVHAKLATIEKPSGDGDSDALKPRAPGRERLAEMAARYAPHGLRAIRGGKPFSTMNRDAT